MLKIHNKRFSIVLILAKYKSNNVSNLQSVRLSRLFISFRFLCQFLGFCIRPLLRVAGLLVAVEQGRRLCAVNFAIATPEDENKNVNDRRHEH